MSEINYDIHKYNIFQFIFLDNDIIGTNISKFYDLLEKLIILRKQFCNVSILNGEIITKGLNPKIVKQLVLAGFKSIQIGYEATSDAILKKLIKKTPFQVIW